MTGMTAPVLDRPVETDRTSGDDGPREHHIVNTTLEQRRRGLDAHAVVTDAYVYGTPVTAICGFKFVPSRDATKLPLCHRCRDLTNA